MADQSSYSSERSGYFYRILQNSPTAYADIRGSAEYPGINGRVNFYQTKYGVLVYSQVFGLPRSYVSCAKHVFAFHIHSGSSCTGTRTDPFANALTHYDLENCEHPAHAGDLLPLWGNNGYTFSVFLTDRFKAGEIIGKTVIVHSDPDDFTSQPAGNSGSKIACGEIVRYAPRRHLYSDRYTI